MSYILQVGKLLPPPPSFYTLPVGARIKGWRQRRKSRLVDIPLADAPIEVSDTMWEPMTVDLELVTWSTANPYENQQLFYAVYKKLMQYQQDELGSTGYGFLRVWEDGTTSVFTVRYDAVMDMDIAYIRRTFGKYTVATFRLLCRNYPYIDQFSQIEGYTVADLPAPDWS